MLHFSMLKGLGVTLMREALCILKQAKEAIQALTVKPPNLNIEMTPQQFRKFRIDWDVFTKMTNMPSSQFNIHLYNCADEAVQNTIINTHPNFFTTDPDKLLVRNHGYLAYADRLTGWLILYHPSYKQTNVLRLISIWRDIFQSYGTPELLRSDGGPPFTSLLFTQIL